MNQPVEPMPGGACEVETYPGENAERRVAAGEFDSAGKNFKALNPRGTPPAIRLRPMAPRAASPAGKTVSGKTVYFVDVRFMNGNVLLGEIQKLFAEQVPGIKTEFRQKRGGYTEDDPELWAEIKAKGALVVMAIGHCSTCAPAVAVHCMHLEDMGIPTAPIVTAAFRDLVKAVAFKAGMPELRFTFVPHPGTPWHDRWRDGALTLLSPHEALNETRLLVERLQGPTMLLSDHVSNFLDVQGQIPKDKTAMLAEIDAALQWPRAAFRPPTERLVGLGL